MTLVYIIEEEDEGVQAVFSSEALAKTYLTADGWTEERKGGYTGWWTRTSAFSHNVSKAWVQAMEVDGVWSDDKK